MGAKGYCEWECPKCRGWFDNDPTRTLPEEDDMRFSRRLQLENEFIEWAEKNKVGQMPSSTIAFLMQKYHFIKRRQ